MSPERSPGREAPRSAEPTLPSPTKSPDNPLNTTTSPAGTYAIRDLPPGEYVLHVEAKGFQPADLLIRIQAAATATGDVKLPARGRSGPPNWSIPKPRKYAARSTTGQMEQIPTDRGFLDLTRLEPGVQLLDGAVLAPSKSGLTAASVVGRNGRTTRMQVDGMDVTDEAVGATTTNVPVGAIQEVEVEQSLLPLSSGLASAGAGERGDQVRLPMIFTASSLATFATRLPAAPAFPGGQGQFLLARSFRRQCRRRLEERQALLFSVRRIFQAGSRRPGRLQRALRCSGRKL